jgi:hypothetical protein
VPLLSFYKSPQSARPWNINRAAAYGALLGALAALFKTLGPLAPSGRSLTDNVLEIAAAALAFAVLCVVAAMLRNFVAQNLVWHGTPPHGRGGK